MIRVEGSRGATIQHGPGTLRGEYLLPDSGAITMERILVVEDDRAVQKALKRLFEAEGFSVEISADGKSALEAFRTAAPAAIVLDLRLPAMSGRDVCREIKQQAPALPIIVLSAASDVSDKVLLLELGADDYVTKPFSPRELLARVRAALRRTVHQRSSRLRWNLGGLRKDGSLARWPIDRTDGPGIQDFEIPGTECRTCNFTR